MKVIIAALALLFGSASSFAFGGKKKTVVKAVAVPSFCIDTSNSRRIGTHVSL
jgi:hypothetical protein